MLLGGTRFIGRAVAQDLATAGHALMYVHRGDTEPGDLPGGEHVHVDRSRFADARDELARFRPDAVVDCYAGTRLAAQAALSALPEGPRLLVLSSMDVYRAYTSFHARRVTDPVPLDETSPVRTGPPPDHGLRPGLEDYEKLDVEEEYLAAGGIVLRLPIVYGEHDYQRREEFVLRRVRARRREIPFGEGTVLFTKGYVADVATGVRLAVEHGGLEGEVFNLGEPRTMSTWRWAEQILVAARWNAQLVRVPDALLPTDLRHTGHIPQHMLVDSSKARTVLGWEETDPETALARSVGWHRAHPPASDGDFSEDDEALAAARHA